MPRETDHDPASGGGALTPLEQLQVRRNRETRGQWSAFAGHRRRVTALLCAAGRGEPICALGAGNCNDIELAELLAHGGEVHLADVDLAAIQAGVARQAPPGEERIVVHAPVDLLGVSAELASWSQIEPPGDVQVASLLRALAAAEWPLPERHFAAAGSVGLLSQLVEGVSLAMGERHPRLVEVVQALRRRHVALLLKLLQRGGVMTLVCDMVSSLTCPELATAPEGQVASVVATALDTQNFFTGMHPAPLEQLVRSDPELAPLVASYQVSRPWRWDLGPRIYGVCAHVIVRK